MEQRHGPAHPGRAIKCCGTGQWKGWRVKADYRLPEGSAIHRPENGSQQDMLKIWPANILHQPPPHPPAPRMCLSRASQCNPSERVSLSDNLNSLGRRHSLIPFACRPLRLCPRSAWLRERKAEIRKKTEESGNQHPGNKKGCFCQEGSLLSDIPSHFNLGEVRTLNIKGFAQESEARERDTEHRGHFDNSQGSFVHSAI